MTVFFVIIAALFLLSGRIAYIYKKNILDSLTVSSAGLLMVMYFLAFFRGLKFTGILGVLVIAYVILRAFLSGRSSSTSFGKELLGVVKKLSEPMVICFILATVAVGFVTADKVFTWWDDINFWSSDAKQFFYINGYPGRYGNVSPEFGDYPPITSLAKWLFLQLSPGEYKESLQFLGYFALNSVFLFPLMARIKSCIDDSEFGKNVKVIAKIVAFAAVMMLPGVFNGIIYYGTPADITMAIVYGALLLAIYDQSAHGKVFYYTRIGLFTAVLLLTKTIGFEWGIFALIFYLMIATKGKEILLSVLGGGGALGSWLLFCFLNRRVAKLTGAGVQMATSGKYRAPDNTMDKMRYFFEGFWTQPMHADQNPTLDLSTGAMVILIFALIFVLYGRNILGKTETRKIALFTILTGLLSYGIVFLAHISIFQTEDQYLDAYAMAVSISRYCAPFTLGMTLVLLGILFNRLRKKGRKKVVPALAAALLLVILTTDYAGAYKYLAGYRDSLKQDMAYNDDMVGDDGRILVEAVSDSRYYGQRVLVLRDGHSYYWVHNAYISKAASPVALVYDSFLVEEDSVESMRQKIKDSHASYIYVEDNEGVSLELFSELLEDQEFEAGKVYKTNGIIN